MKLARGVRRRIPLRVRSAPPAAPAERWSACYAPHSSMYFDQFGKVRACCQNTGVYLGDVTEQSLREIWESADAEAMRSALEVHDYGQGCEFCEWQVREGNDAIVFARGFDRFEPAERRPTWPRHLEFSLTNTCNLQCVMCNGDWSSTIRAKREGRDPIPVVYGDAFYEQLAPFLPHVEEVAFLGGEPFLGKEPLRVMEMLAELERPPRVTITTNGTIWTARVARIVEALRPHIVISLDGASTETYDEVRVGAHYPDVIANMDRFAAARPGDVSITTCLMRQNWHEFAAILTLAEERGMSTGVNVVRFPQAQSLYQLPEDELRVVVEQMQATDVTLTGERLEAWEGHVTALAHRLDVVSAPRPELGPAHGLPGAPQATATSEDGPGYYEEPPPSSPWPWLPFPEEAEPGTVAPGPDPNPSFASWHIDTEGIVTVRRQDPDAPVDVLAFQGQHIQALAERLHELFGPQERWATEPRVRPADDDRFRLRPGDPADPAPMEMIGRAERDEHGVLIGGTFELVHAPIPSPAT